MDDNDERQLLMKISIFGLSSAGTPHIVQRYIEGPNYDLSHTSIPRDYCSKKIIIDNTPIKLQIWCSGSLNGFDQMNKSYLRGSNGILLCFDLTDLNSFNGIITLIERYADCIPDGALIFLVGNKCDLVNEREVTEEMIGNLRLNINYKYFETSAKTGQGIDECFECLARLCKAKIDDNSDIPNQTPILSTKRIKRDNKETKNSCI